MDGSYFGRSNFLGKKGGVGLLLVTLCFSFVIGMAIGTFFDAAHSFQ